MKNLRLLFLLIAGLTSGWLCHAEVKVTRKKVPSQAATVGLEGATVYEAPDFDSRVLIQLEPGYKVVISLKPKPGVEGMGAFYRIKYAKQKLGYVADTEVIPEYQNKGQPKSVKNPDFKKVEELRERALSGREAITFTKYWGASFQRASYREKYSGQSLTSPLDLYGVRFTGPGILFDGPPLDVNLAVAPEAPRHYQTLNGRSASGFLVLMDMLMMVPFFETLNFTVNGGLGVMANYSKFRVPDASKTVNTQHFRLGLSADLGCAYRLERFLLRGDLKYFYDGSGYSSVLLSFQQEY